MAGELGYIRPSSSVRAPSPEPERQRAHSPLTQTLADRFRSTHLDFFLIPTADSFDSAQLNPDDESVRESSVCPPFCYTGKNFFLSVSLKHRL